MLQGCSYVGINIAQLYLLLLYLLKQLYNMELHISYYVHGKIISNYYKD